MGFKRPDDFYLYIDGKGNAEMRVRFRREDIPYLSRAIGIVDDILAIDDEEQPGAEVGSSLKEKQ